MGHFISNMDHFERKLINKNVPVAKKMKENMQMVDSFHHIMQKNENENFGGLYLTSN